MTEPGTEPSLDINPGLVPGGEAGPDDLDAAAGETAGEPTASPGERGTASPGEPGPRRRDHVTPLGEPDVAVGGRPLALRLARLHLRMGQLPLARAELEAFAGANRLDEPALVDLAEARWRTGDLAGAGEAANAAVERGVDDPLAFVIAAEAVVALGRPAEARRLAARALDELGVSLEVAFAGMPRSGFWPADPAEDEALAEAALAVARERSEGLAGRGPASAAAAEAYAGGRGALARGDVPTAALRLSVAIRLEPAFAREVLGAIGDRAATEPLLALVVGDALRLLDREPEALAAYDVARGKPRSGEPEPTGGRDPADADEDIG